MGFEPAEHAENEEDLNRLWRGQFMDEIIHHLPLGSMSEEFVHSCSMFAHDIFRVQCLKREHRSE